MSILDNPITAALDLGGKIIGRLWPDPADQAKAQLALLQLAQNGELAQLTAETDLAKAQIKVNEVEAASGSLFVAGPRPFLMWIGGIGVAMQWVIVPVASFVYTTATGHALPVQPPEIDSNILALVGSLMGIHIGARSWEKVKGVAS
jgi:Holin of 3TMs, for gene-transfer release